MKVTRRQGTRQVSYGGSDSLGRLNNVRSAEAITYNSSGS